ncbi:hypothetical protein [Dokdonella sp.]|uniref:hypothetical protein n=1 Tax=Dokdonella sp. TaxID=2291710 RepID=UPI0031CABC98|nr:hypothetical protein [Dokdonella sp.]
MSAHEPATRRIVPAANRTLPALLGLTCALLPCAGNPKPVLDYTVGIGWLHDDNVTQSETDARSDNILAPRLAFSLDQQGASLSALAAGTIEYRKYLSGTFNSQFAAVVSGSAAWHISPDRLDWVVEDYVGRQPINVLANNDPDNQQQTNVFSTGPTLRAHFSDALRGQLDLRYTRNYAEVSKDFNGDRISGAGRLLYLLGQGDLVTGNLRFERARFDLDPDTSDYDRTDLYAGYSHDGSSIDLVGNLGYSRIDFTRGSGVHDGVLANATLTWNPSATDALSIHVADSLVDAASELAIDPSRIGQPGELGIGSGLNGVVISPDVYRARELRLGYGRSTARYRLSVAPFLRKLSYLDDTESDQRSRGLYADFAWSFTPLTTLTVYCGGENRTYLSLDRNDDDRSYGARLSWRSTRHWEWIASYARLRRDSDTPGQSYTDNILGLALAWHR